MDDLTPWVVALIAALAPLLTVVLTERRPPELRRARWLGDEASRMREGTAERRLVEDARDDEIVGWVIARTGPGAGILFLIATYLWGVAAVLGIVAIIAALAAIASPPLFSAAGMYGIATILTITLSAIPYGVEQARRQARSRAVRSALGLREPVAEWRTRTGTGAESPRTGAG